MGGGWSVSWLSLALAIANQLKPNQMDKHIETLVVLIQDPTLWTPSMAQNSPYLILFPLFFGKPSLVSLRSTSLSKCNMATDTRPWCFNGQYVRFLELHD
ncbi:unnamed protein product [Dovyalis caffra]|uniref:Secreted protein n=1 Tax=Dovyalis caffra TaxID=77055 RepID=A0AAV1R3I4_9ROSI|nr:unnamed protein product [Dovyalis caffra]